MTFEICIIREDLKSKNLLFTEEKKQYGKSAMQQKVCFGETVLGFFWRLTSVCFVPSVEFKLGLFGLSEM
jgi:hypothetical protein